MQGIEKLVIGKIYKYKELCVLFNEEEKSHHSKDAQKKRWACYFRWSNPTKQKYLIEEIYLIPLDKVDGRKNNGGNNTSKYQKLDDILMDYFEENESVSTTMPKLAVEIGLLSESYEFYRSNSKEYSGNNDIPKYIVDAYFANIQGCVLRSLRTSLERLKKDKHIHFDDFITLVLFEKGKVELSVSESDEIVAMETQVRDKMGITMFDLFIGKQKTEYDELMRKKIFERFGYDIKYYYRKYIITKLNNIYTKRSNEDSWRLTRKFIITIGNEMLKSVCTFNNIEYDHSQLIKEIIDMTNHFFVYMNHESWDAYWNEDELDWEKEERAMLFWSQYCLVEASDYNEKQKQKEEQRISLENEYLKQKMECRNHALEYLGEDVVVEYEYILPDLNWKKAMDSPEYGKIMTDALDEYYKWKFIMGNSTDGFIEEYGLYVARLVADGKKEEQIPFYEFKDLFRNGVITFKY